MSVTYSSFVTGHSPDWLQYGRFQPHSYAPEYLWVECDLELVNEEVNSPADGIKKPEVGGSESFIIWSFLDNKCETVNKKHLHKTLWAEMQMCNCDLLLSIGEENKPRKKYKTVPNISQCGTDMVV